jgi:hypothetical protein
LPEKSRASRHASEALRLFGFSTKIYIDNPAALLYFSNPPDSL